MQDISSIGERRLPLSNLSVWPPKKLMTRANKYLRECHGSTAIPVASRRHWICVSRVTFYVRNADI